MEPRKQPIAGQDPSGSGVRTPRRSWCGSLLPLWRGIFVAKGPDGDRRHRPERVCAGDPKAPEDWRTPRRSASSCVTCGIRKVVDCDGKFSAAREAVRQNGCPGFPRRFRVPDTRAVLRGRPANPKAVSPLCFATALQDAPRIRASWAAVSFHRRARRQKAKPSRPRPAKAA